VEEPSCVRKQADGRRIRRIVAHAGDFYEVYYGPVLLGWFDETENFFAADAGAEPKPRHAAKAQGGAR